MIRQSIKRINFIIPFLFILPICFSSAEDYYPVDLSRYFNNDGIATDANRNDGNYDAIGEYSPATFNYSAEELPKSNSLITCFNIPFLFPDKSDGKKNNILSQGELIELNTGHYTGIYILGASVNGSYSEPVVIRYADQSISTSQLALSDWCMDPIYGELPAITAQSRQMINGNRIPDRNRIWLQTLDFDTTKPLSAIRLPKSQSLHIFALTFGAGEPVILSEVIIPKGDQVEKKEISVSFQSSQPGNIFYAGETARLRVLVTKIPDTIKKINLNWQVRDLDENLIQKKEDILTQWFNQGFIYPIQLNGKNPGWYQIRLELSHGGEILTSETTCLAWLIGPSASGSDLNSKLGMGMGFSKLSTHEIEISGQLVKSAGIKWIREEFSWGRIEPRENQWDWSDYDKSVAVADQYQLNILGLLDYWTGWSKPYTGDGYRQYAKYVSQVVHRYKHKIKYWEIWNEPNIFYWKGTPEQYVELLKLAYQAAKKADPDSKIAGCVTAQMDLKFIERVFQAGGMDYMDIISVHPYRDSYPDETGLMEDIKKLEDLINKYNKEKTKKEIWLTEIGWWTNNTGGEKGVDYEKQAACLVRTYVMAMGSNQIDKVFPYTFRDSGWRSDYPEDNFGILRADYSPKPSYVAIANMSKLLTGYGFISTFEFDNQDTWYLFQKGKEKLIVAWHHEGIAIIGVHSDANSLTVTDIYGNQKTFLPMDQTISINLSPMPVFISGQFTQFQKIARIMELRMLEARVNQGDKTDLKLELQNIFSKDIIGNVAIIVSDSVRDKLFFEDQEKQVEIKPGEKKEIFYQLNVSENASLGLTPIEVKMDTKDGGRFRLQTELIIGRKKTGKTNDKAKPDDNTDNEKSE